MLIPATPPLFTPSVLYCFSLINIFSSFIFQDLHLYSVNGKHLAQETVPHPVTTMLIANSYLILGNNLGNLVIKDLLQLRTINTMPLHIPITCLAVTNGNSHLLVGLKDGKLIIVGIKRPSEVKK